MNRPALSAPLILLVDDEPAVLTSTTRLLEHLGYAVEAFSDPLEAIVAYTRNPTRYALAITDVMTPGLSGPTFALRLREARADLPIVLWTGYADLLDDPEIQRLRPAALLHKPVSLEELGRTLDHVLRR